MLGVEKTPLSTNKNSREVLDAMRIDGASDLAIMITSLRLFLERLISGPKSDSKK